MITRNFGRIQSHEFHHKDELRFYQNASDHIATRQAVLDQQVCETTGYQSISDEFVNWKNRTGNKLQCCLNAVSDLHLFSLQFA